MSSTLQNESAETVWARISSWEGVNYELGPLVQMSVPAEFPHLIDIPADGVSHFTSRILFLGWLPIDQHHFGLKEIKPPHFFDERSENRMMRVWTHKRTVSSMHTGVVVTDECSFEPRLGWLGPLLLGMYKLVFTIRHKRLRSYFQNR